MTTPDSAEAVNGPALSEILDAIAIEVDRAIAKHGPWPNSCHHGHSVLLEEVEELWEEIKADKGRLGPAKREAIQVAAVAVRYVMELCYHEQKPAASSSLSIMNCERCGKIPVEPGFRGLCIECRPAATALCTHCNKNEATKGGYLCDRCRLESETLFRQRSEMPLCAKCKQRPADPGFSGLCEPCSPF